MIWISSWPYQLFSFSFTCIHQRSWPGAPDRGSGADIYEVVERVPPQWDQTVPATSNTSHPREALWPRGETRCLRNALLSNVRGISQVLWQSAQSQFREAESCQHRDRVMYCCAWEPAKTFFKQGARILKIIHINLMYARFSKFSQFYLVLKRSFWGVFCCCCCCFLWPWQVKFML